MNITLISARESPKEFGELILYDLLVYHDNEELYLLEV